MKKQILAVCDSEEEYTRRLCEFLQRKGLHTFEIIAFTSRKKVMAFAGESEITLLLICEKEFEKSLYGLISGQIIILGEQRFKEKRLEEKTAYIYKYQSCEAVFQELMGYTAETKGIQPATFSGFSADRTLKIIGLYTPVHRSLQTTFAFVLGQLLAGNHQVLYLNFESYSGIRERMEKEFRTDMSDFMYYLNTARDSLYFRLKSMTETIGNMDFIPPGFSYMDICGIEKEQWFLLFEELKKHTSYEYLILDLSDHMQGLFDILRICTHIFTLIKEDGIALAKVAQYEKLLQYTAYEDVLEKTKKCSPPLFSQIPERFEELPYSELAAYTKKLIKETLYDG